MHIRDYEEFAAPLSFRRAILLHDLMHATDQDISVRYWGWFGGDCMDPVWQELVRRKELEQADC